MPTSGLRSVVGETATVAIPSRDGVQRYQTEPPTASYPWGGSPGWRVAASLESKTDTTRPERTVAPARSSFGGAATIRHARRAGHCSRLPEASLERTMSSWSPSARSAYETGDEH